MDARIIRIAKAAGAVISYDPNYRAPLWDSVQTAKQQMRSLLPYVDIMKLSDEETALLTDREGHFVYVVNEAGIAQRRPVSIGAKADGRVAVRSGVKTGERVVVQGTQKVVHDQPVTLAPAKEADRK